MDDIIIIVLLLEDSPVKVGKWKLTHMCFFFWLFYFCLAANIVLFPFSYLVSSSGEESKSPIADISIHVLLVLVHYHKCLVSEDYANHKSSTSDSLLKENPHFSDNPYCKALEHAIDCECNIFFVPMHVFLIEKASKFFYPTFKCSGSCRY